MVHDLQARCVVAIYHTAAAATKLESTELMGSDLHLAFAIWQKLFTAISVSRSPDECCELNSRVAFVAVTALCLGLAVEQGGAEEAHHPIV